MSDTPSMETRNGASDCRYRTRRLQFKAPHLRYTHATLTLHFSRSIVASTDGEVGSTEWRHTNRIILFLIFVLDRATSSKVSGSSRGRPDFVRFPSWAAGRLTACPRRSPGPAPGRHGGDGGQGLGVQGPRAGRTRLSLFPLDEARVWWRYAGAFPPPLRQRGSVGDRWSAASPSSLSER
jgi:hypothetical protein